jgi:hypothetical protein
MDYTLYDGLSRQAVAVIPRIGIPLHNLNEDILLPRYIGHQLLQTLPRIPLMHLTIPDAFSCINAATFESQRRNLAPVAVAHKSTKTAR